MVGRDGIQPAETQSQPCVPAIQYLLSPAFCSRDADSEAITMSPNRPTNHPARQNRLSGNHRQQHPNAAGLRSYDSQGPEVRIRGSLHQIITKYETLAREAGSTGNFVAVQNYLQHAEHYIRLAKTQGKPTQESRDDIEQISAAEAGDLRLVAAD
jgi:hypothetical protein